MALRGFTIFNFFLVKFKNGPPDAVIKIFSICDVLKPLFSEYIEKCSESIGTKEVLFFFNCVFFHTFKPGVRMLCASLSDDDDDDDDDDGDDGGGDDDDDDRDARD